MASNRRGILPNFNGKKPLTFVEPILRTGTKTAFLNAVGKPRMPKPSLLINQTRTRPSLQSLNRNQDPLPNFIGQNFEPTKNLFL